MGIKDKFDKICNMTYYDNVSFFKINKDRKFILIKSKNSEVKGTVLNEIQTLSIFCDGINVLCAEPGMGKTSSMKNFRNKCSSDQWTVFIELRQFGSLFVKSRFELNEVLNHCFKKSEKDVLVTEMRKIFEKKKTIAFFLDGLDELDSKGIDNVLIFVRHLKEKGFTVWLSSRNNIKDKIEKELNLFSIDINEVSEKQQIEYIKKRLEPFNYSENEINQIISNMFIGVGIQNNVSILGIPLQLFMLTQIFIDDKSNSNKNNSKSAEKQFLLTKLYKKYFEGKIKHSLQKDGLTNESGIKRMLKLILKEYHVSALRSCLDEENFKSLNLKQSKLYKNEKFINGIKKNGDKFGIIKNVSENKTITFVHHTHGEYFAAIYLSQNIDKVRILGESFLSQKYDNLRLLFDIKLAEDKPLHLSVIYRNLDQFNENIKNGCDVKDKGGRTPLHLACVCGTKYSPLKYKQNKSYYNVLSNIKKENESFMKITDKLVELCDVMTKDEIFEWDEIDYATKCWSLYPLQAILKQQQNEQELNQMLDYKRRHWILKIINFRKFTLAENWDKKLNLTENKEALAYYSARFGYQILLKILLVSFNFSFNELKYNKQTRVTLLHEACKEGHKEIAHLLLNHGTEVDVFDLYKNTPLHYGCAYGHTETALLLIKNNAEVNRVNENLDTPLYLACKNGHKEIADLLIRNKAEVNSVAKYGYTPLHRACLSGHTEIALLLIRNNADLNSVDQDGDTPLHCACLKGYTAIAHLLIENNADVNSVRKNRYNPLHRVCVGGHTTTALLFLKDDADLNFVDKYGDTPLHCACLKGCTEIAHLLIKNGADVNSVGNNRYTPLHHACLNGHTDIALLLIQNNADLNSVNVVGDTPLHCAILNRHTEIAHLLIENNADVHIVTRYGYTPLHRACLPGHTETALLLIQNKADVNSVGPYGDTPLHRACLEGCTETAHLLIKNGADMNSVDEYGDTPLHRAISNGHTEIVLLLIQNNADLNSVDQYGNTPLHSACANGHTEIAHLLIRNNADVNKVDKYLNTPLHLACRKGYNEIALLLIKNSAIVNCVNPTGDTPLHCACNYGHTETAHLLIQNKADVNSVGDYGDTPLHRACLNGHTEIALLLIQNLAEVNRVNKFLNNPLHLACFGGYKEIAHVLIQNNADVNIVNGNGYTPLLPA